MSTIRLILCIAALVVLAACAPATPTPTPTTAPPVPTFAVAPTAPPAPTATQPPARGTLRYHQPYDQRTLDPQISNAVSDMQLETNLFDSLLRYKFGTADLESALAESWEPSSDGLTWTFKLRRGVKFHKNFGEMKASDVKFSLDRIFDKAVNSPLAPQLAFFDKVEVVDDYTVRISLKRADPSFLYRLAASYTSIVSEKAVKEKGDKFGQDPIGTGPFQFEQWRPQQETVMNAFDDYWGGKPKIAQLVYVVIPDSITAYTAFESGDVDLIQVSDPDRLKKYKQNANLIIAETASLSTRFLGMVPKHAPLDNLKVRQAISHAVNRKDISEGVSGGMSVLAKGPLAPGVKYYDPNLTQYAYDPAKAKQLLADAGFGSGFKVTVAVPNNERFTKPAVVIQENLKAVGIQAEIKTMETQAFLVGFRDYPLYVLAISWDPIPDPTLLVGYSSKGPMSKSADAQLDQMIMTANATLEDSKRKDLFLQIQKRITDEALDVFIDNESFVYAMSKRVKGFVADPQRLFNFRPVTVEGK